MKSWVKYVLGSVAVLVAVATWQSQSSPLRISAEEAKKLLKSGAALVDVRTDTEVKALGADARALHIPAAELDSRVNELPDKNKHIVLYCNTGQRARAAAEKLQRFGQTKVHYIVGSQTSLKD